MDRCEGELARALVEGELARSPVEGEISKGINSSDFVLRGH
jgi:hypothetical protein